MRTMTTTELAKLSYLFPLVPPSLVRSSSIVQKQSSGEGEDTILSPTRLYVTDVVTSSKHRRMGIANALMDALESYAAEKFETDNTLLYLHVKEDNVAAQKFYRDARR